MKTLTVMRHAKAMAGIAGGRDIDRALAERGRADAVRIGAEMRRLRLVFDAVFASPAMRVAETVADLREGYGVSLPVEIRSEIYEASLAALLDLVRSTGDGVESLLVVGHNPALHQLTLHLVGAGEGRLREALADGLPTGTLVEIGLPIVRWADAEVGSGTLHRFVRPRDL